MIRYVPLMLKNALRNRRRSVLTILSIGASLCLLGLIFALYRGLFLAPPQPGQELRLITHHKVSMTQPLPISFGPRIRQIPGVHASTVYQWFGGAYKDARDRRNFFARFCVEPEHYLQVHPEFKIPDDQKQAFIKLRTGAIATSDLAKRMGWNIGEKIFLTGDIYPVNPELTLVGIAEDPNGTEGLLFNYAYLREMLGPGPRGDSIGAFQIEAESADVVPQVQKGIDDLFANSPAPTRTETEQQFVLQFASALGNIKMFLVAISAAVTFTILLVSANTMAMSVRERVREVGILKTLGYTPGAILFMILGEAGVISMIGGAVGLLLAALLTALIRQGPAFIGAMRTLSITPDVGAISLVLAVVIGVGSSLIPAWNAARTPILDSLRNTG